MYIVEMIFHILLLNFLTISSVWSGDYEKRLYEDLQRDYSVLARPVTTLDTPVVVTLGMDFQQIIDISEKEQLMISNIWLKMNWSDIYLSWDKEEYGNVTEVRLPIDSIWRPDVLLYNSAHQEFDSTWKTNAIVRNDGSVEWIPPGIFTTTCKMDIQWFPFDDQHCPIKFGSWTFSGAQIDLQNGSVVLETYMTNGEWFLMDVSAERNIQKYECCPDPYYDVTFNVWVRRRSLYYGFNLVIPCALISAMTMLGFILPPECGEKLSLGITIFMSICVFLLMVAEAMPKTSEAVPLISTYFSVNIVLICVSVVFTVLVLNYHHRNPNTHNHMSPFMQKIFLKWLPSLMFMTRPGENFSFARSCRELPSCAETCPVIRSSEKPRPPRVLSAFGLDMDTDSMSRYLTETQLTEPSEFIKREDSCLTEKSIDVYGVLSPMGSPDHIKSGLRQIGNQLRFISDRMKAEDDEKEVCDDWLFAAMVVDRLCLIFFTVFLVVATAAVFISAPHIA